MTHTTPLGSELTAIQLGENINDLLSSGKVKFNKNELMIEPGASQKESFLNDNVSELVEFVSDEIDELDLSVIPDGVRADSFLIDSVLDESQRVDNPNNLKLLVLESTGISVRGWCRSCMVCQGKETYGCRIM